MFRIEVLRLVGKPDRKTGSGLDIHVYLLSNGTEVLLGWAGESLVYVTHNKIDLLTREKIPQ